MFRFTSALMIAAAAIACQTKGSGAPPADTTSKSAEPARYATRSVKGEVSLELTPQMTNQGLVVTFHPETHSGDLADIDLAKVRLEADGKTYEPLASKPMSGHHGDGSVTFDLKTAPQRFSITMGEVRGSGPLRFEWP